MEVDPPPPSSSTLVPEENTGINVEYLMFSMVSILKLPYHVRAMEESDIAFYLVYRTDREAYGWSEDEFDNILAVHPSLNNSRMYNLLQSMKEIIIMLLDTERRSRFLEYIDSMGGLATLPVLIDTYSGSIALCDVPSLINSFFDVLMINFRSRMISDKKGSIISPEEDIVSTLINNLNDDIEDIINDYGGEDRIDMDVFRSLFNMNKSEISYVRQLSSDDISEEQKEEIKDKIRESIRSRMIPFIKEKTIDIISKIQMEIEKKKRDIQLVFRMINEAYYDTFEIVKVVSEYESNISKLYKILRRRTKEQIIKDNEREELIEKSQMQESRMNLIFAYILKKKSDDPLTENFFPLSMMPIEIVEHISTFLIDGTSLGYELFILSELYSEYMNKKQSNLFDLSLSVLKVKKFVSEFKSQIKTILDEADPKDLKERRKYYNSARIPIIKSIKEASEVLDFALTPERQIAKSIKIMEYNESLLVTELSSIQSNEAEVYEDFNKFLQELSSMVPGPVPQIILPKKRMAKVFISTGERKAEEAKIVMDTFDPKKAMMHIRVYISKSISLIKTAKEEIRNMERKFQRSLELEKEESEAYGEGSSKVKKSRISHKIMEYFNYKRRLRENNYQSKKPAPKIEKYQSDIYW